MDSPFHNRPEELGLYLPLVGSSMLELGNKKNREHIYKAFFESHGFRHVSVDMNGLDGALNMDLRKPLNLGTFDMVANIGTTEHVSDQAGVWRNICEAMHIGSVLVSVTPLPGDWPWHGEWYPTDGFYSDLARLNGLDVERLYVAGEAPRKLNLARMKRVSECPFEMPEGGLYKNR